MWGTNSRLDNLQAAIVSHKLASYSDMMKRRRWIAARYDALLKAENVANRSFRRDLLD